MLQWPWQGFALRSRYAGDSPMLLATWHVQLHSLEDVNGKALQPGKEYRALAILCQDPEAVVHSRSEGPSAFGACRGSVCLAQEVLRE